MWAPRSWRVKLAISMKTPWESERTQTAYFASLFAWILDKRHPLSGPWNITTYLARNIQSGEDRTGILSDASHTAVPWIFQCRLQSLCTTEYFSLKAHFYFEVFVCVWAFGCLETEIATGCGCLGQTRFQSVRTNLKRRSRSKAKQQRTKLAESTTCRHWYELV